MILTMTDLQVEPKNRPHGVVGDRRREEGEELVLRVRHGRALVRLEAHVALRRGVAQLHVGHVRRHQVCEKRNALGSGLGHNMEEFFLS